MGERRNGRDRSAHTGAIAQVRECVDRAARLAFKPAHATRWRTPRIKDVLLCCPWDRKPGSARKPPNKVRLRREAGYRLWITEETLIQGTLRL